MARNVKAIALADIAEWMRTQKIQIQDEHGDVWVVSAAKLKAREQTKLNKEIGASKINYTKKGTN